MRAFTILITGAIVLGVASVACSNSGDSDSQSLVLSDFPTPTISRASQVVAEQPAPEPSNGPGLAPSGDVSPEDIAQLRERFQSGEITQEELAALRQRFQGGIVSGRGQGGFGGQRGLVGMIETIDDAMLAIDTSQGPLLATVNPDTTIVILSEGSPEDLITGMNVSIDGERGEDGTVNATFISVTPQDVAGQFGGGQRAFRQGQGGGGQAGGQGFFGGQSGRGQGTQQPGQFQGRVRPDGGQGFFGGRQGLRGTIASIEGNRVTIDTPQGPLRVATGADTIVLLTSEGSLEDLAASMRVFVNGQPGQDGNIEASSIVVVSDDQDGFFWGGGVGQQRLGQP